MTALLSKEDIRRYIQSNSFDIQHAPCAIYTADRAFSVYTKVPKYGGIRYAPQLIFFRDAFFWQFTAEDTLQSYARGLFDHAVAHPDWVGDFFKREFLAFERTRQVWADIDGGDINRTGVESFLEALDHWWEFGVVGEDKGRVAEEQVLKRLIEVYGFEHADARDFVAGIAHTQGMSRFGQEKCAFLDLCIALKNGGEPEVGDYITKYFYARTTFLDKVELTPQTVLADVQNEVGDKSLDELMRQKQDLLDTHAALAAQAEELMARREFSPEDRRRIDYLRFIAEWVDLRKVHMASQLFWLMSIAHCLAEMHRIPYTDVVQYFTADLTALAGGTVVSSREIEKRRSGMMVLYDGEVEPRIFYGEEAASLFAIGQKTPNGKEIKGTVASRGKGGIVSGIARVVLDPSTETMRSGEILVTSMTRPEFLPLMQHALAIVTDEGGIACHAAIVSRELGLPCVIGTKSATRTFQSGDRIEVDTKTGIVRKL